MSQKSAGKGGENLTTCLWTSGIRTGDSLNAWRNDYRYAYEHRQGIHNDCWTFNDCPMVNNLHAHTYVSVLALPVEN
jgi:hypothetical protein